MSGRQPRKISGRESSSWPWMGVSCHLAHALDSGGELGAAACRCIPRHAGPAAGAGWAGPWRLRRRQ
eukprot:scaffold84694_cov41-Phaeocystis_antarctica.AAC.1